MATIRHKFLSHEVDGVEQAYPTEVPLDGDKVYFTKPGYTSDNVQDAIAETGGNSGQSRYAARFGYNGNANSGRWLELFTNAASNDTPLVIAENSEIANISVSCAGSSSGATYTVYKNGSSVATISIGDGTGQTNTGYKIITPAVSLAPGDTLSAQQTSSPSATDPIVSVNIKVTY